MASPLWRAPQQAGRAAASDAAGEGEVAGMLRTLLAGVARLQGAPLWEGASALASALQDASRVRLRLACL